MGQATRVKLAAGRGGREERVSKGKETVGFRSLWAAARTLPQFPPPGWTLSQRGFLGDLCERRTFRKFHAKPPRRKDIRWMQSKTLVYQNEQIAENRVSRSSIGTLHHTKGSKWMGRRSIKRGPGKRHIDSQDFQLAEEIRYIQRRAAEHDGRFVTVGSLTWFSTDTGDAWLLDPEDHLAVRLARDGDPEELYFEETETNFAIGWKGHYRRFANIITYPKHRITNATSESINAKIQWVKYTARGFRNKQHFINAIYFHCGGLDLAPATTK